MKNKLISVGCLFLVAYSCSVVNKKYPYYDDFAKYMYEIHGRDLTKVDDNIIYIFDISCNDCAEKNLEMLDSLDFNNKLIVIKLGKPDVMFKEKTSKISSKFICYDDTLSIAYNYLLSIDKTLLIHVKSGGCLYYDSYPKSNLIDLKRYIERYIGN